MKKTNNLIYTVPLIATLIPVLIAVPLRIYQYFELINPQTGFYDNTDFTVTLLYIILAVSAAVCVFSAFLKHKSLQPVTIGKNSKIFLTVCIVMAFGVAIDSFSTLSDYLSAFSEIGNTAVEASPKGDTLLLAQVITGAVSAVYFVISGLSSVNTNNTLKLRILALIPVIWCIFRLLYRFKRTISFVNVSDLLLELFAIVFAMMFFLALAQVNSKIDASAVFWKLFAYGFPAVAFSLTCSLPRFILLINGNSDKLNELYPASFADIAFAVYTVYICISAAKAKITASEE